MPHKDPQHGWVDTGEVKLHFCEWPGEEPTLLCIHGLTANARQWDAVAERLGGRHRVVAVDMRGRGLSDKPPTGQYGLSRHARDMAALLNLLGTGPAVAVGQSMGAFVALKLAAERPELVSHLLLIDGGYLGDELTEDVIRAQIATALQRLAMVFPSFPAYLDHWRQVPYVQPWTEYFERYLAADVEERADGSVACRVSPAAVEEDLLQVTEAAGDKWDETLRRIAAPAHVLWAPEGLLDARQPFYPRRAVEQLAALLLTARLTTIAGTNHYTIVFKPDGVEQVVAALGELLADALPEGRQ